MEERIYQKLEDGKSDFSKAPQRDIKTEYLQQFCQVVEDMIYYREREYDSETLILQLFEKLPSEVANKLAIKLGKDYTFDID